MREIDVIERIRARAPKTNLIRGIGDDCAVFRPRTGEDLVFTTDFLLESRHFERHTHRPADVGHKALARSLSDLAAMGSEPAFCLVSLAVPADIGSRWIDSFYTGLLALARKYQLALAGGDLARFNHIAVDVMCCGRVASGSAMLRSAAKPGEHVFVTGQLGTSALGFATQHGAAWRRHLHPQPRIEAGLTLRKRGVRACLDLSDGLSLDLHRLCLESHVGAELDAAQLPIARGASLEHALDGGEDYELLFTAPPSLKIPARIGQVPVTSIGTITRAHPGRVLLDGRQLEPHGFDHFANPDS
jgi:thiamine-monophosphate kinase